MSKNIRKHSVNSVEEILFGLKKESNVLFASFVNTSEKIKNDVLVRNFWNILVKCAKLIKSENIYAEKDKLIIAEPELYDIELVFNGYTREDIDTSEYDGKAEYQKKHDELAAKDMLRTKLQKDLESDEEKAA